MSAPTIYCDLIEEQPAPREKFFADRAGMDVDDIATTYRQYLDNFQPWRILVLSGDNHEPLFRSTERYLHREDAIHAVELAFGNQSNVYLRESEHGNVELRLAAG